MKKINILPKISLLERYLISEIIPVLLFNIVIITIVAESVGISFEKFSFLMNQKISFQDLIYLHILKIPEFIVFAVPIAILMTTILVYNKLSNSREVVALQSCGLSLNKIIYPVINLSIIITLILFITNAFIVPIANYKAAITLESVMNVNRWDLNDEDIVYQELALTQQNQHKYLKHLLYAEGMKNGKMSNVTLLIRNNQKLKLIIESKFAEWNTRTGNWNFYDGIKSKINPDGSYGQEIKFQQFTIYLPNISQQLQLEKEKLDDREMNIFQVHQRLLMAEKLGNTRNIIKFKINLQKRFTLPISCIVFAFLGSSIGINLQPRIKYNSFTMTLVIIWLMKICEAIINALIISENISIFTVWIPNFFAMSMSFYLFLKKN